MAKYSNMFSENVIAYQTNVLNYGKCSICNRGLSQGETVYVGCLADGSMATACEGCKNSLTKVIRHFMYHPKKYVVPPKDTLLWRYQDFPKFVSLLDSGNLFFTRADKFEDIFEGARGFNFQKDAIYASMRQSLFYKSKTKLINQGNDRPTDEEIESKVKEATEAMIEAQKEKRKDYFVSCWHANEMESEAMWKLYINIRNQGIAIQTTMERLCYSIGKEGFEVGDVNYISYETPLGVDDVPIWYKRTAFKHENEVRAIFHSPNTNSFGMPIKVDLDLLIDKVYISPSAPDWFAKLVENIMFKYGINKKVEHSKLDLKPIY